MLGGGISLISRTGESDEEEEEEEEEEEDMDEDTTSGGRLPQIAPILIKQRAPPPAFSVTSRPPLRRTGDGADTGGTRSSVFSVEARSALDAPPSSGSECRGRQRSGTLVPSVAAPPTAKPLVDRKKDGYHTNTSEESSDASEESDAPPPVMKATSSSSKQRGSMTLPNSGPGTTMTTRPFASGRRQRESPASSTGDSSSGRAPGTPKDGSEIGRGVNGAKERGWGSGVSGLGGQGGRHFKRQSVSFEDDISPAGDGGVGGKAKSSLGDEERRRERRRSEAKAAIEVCFFLLCSERNLMEHLAARKRHQWTWTCGRRRRRGRSADQPDARRGPAHVHVEPHGWTGQSAWRGLWHADVRKLDQPWDDGQHARVATTAGVSEPTFAVPGAVHAAVACRPYFYGGTPAGDDVCEAGVPDSCCAAGDGGCCG